MSQEEIVFEDLLDTLFNPKNPKYVNEREVSFSLKDFEDKSYFPSTESPTYTVN